MTTLADSKRARAFTLLELLVVIAVIALLLALALPALARSRDAARGCKCLVQLRTLGQFTHLHADARGDQLPRSQHSAFAARTLPWGYAFFEYLTERAYTPGDDGWAPVFNGPYRCPLDTRRDRWSYGYNVYFELTSDETGGPTWRRLSQVPRPAQTVLFGELARASGGDHAMAHFWKQFHAPPEIDAQRHRPGTGAAFADGHARTQSFESLFDLAADRDRFNPGATR